MVDHHILMGKKVPVDKYDTDHLLRLMLKISKRCHKFALKHTKSVNAEDGGVWVARGFVSVGLPLYKKLSNNPEAKNKRWELSTMDEDPLIVAEKFLTMLTEHEEKFNTFREELDTKDIHA